MIAKLIVHGADRATAVARLAHVLQQYQILGLNTNLGFLGRLVAMPEFIAADFDTGFIATHHERLFARDDERFNRALLLAAAAMLSALDSRAQSAAGNSPWDCRSQWRMNLQARQCVRLEHEGLKYEVVIERRRNGWNFACNGNDSLLDGNWIDQHRMRLEVNAEVVKFPVFREPDSIALIYQGHAFKFELGNAHDDAASDAANADHPQAPMSGAVVALSVAVGDTVEPGTTLVVVEAMKMEHAIVAQVHARVGEILVTVGDQVEEGDTLVLLEVE
jgi:3-methylcrotonyl-CoA carboxylase alpha subunit